jgi:hypothetical protein
VRLLPSAPSDNERALAQEYVERITGLTTVNLTLAYPVATTHDGVTLLLLAKNGAILDPNGGAGGYSVTGTAVTLGTAAIAGDIFVARYSYRN